MRENAIWPEPERSLVEDGCAYVLDGGGVPRACRAPRRAGSPYCPRHHSLCHVASGSAGEVRRLREVEALASAVGGRRARDRAGPSRRFLERLEEAVRDFS